MGKKKTEEPTNAPVALTPPAPVTNKTEDAEEDTPVVKALKSIDDKYCKIEMEFEHEMEMLRQKHFKEKQAPLLAERSQVLSQTKDVPAEDHQYGTPGCKGFWLQAFQNSEAIGEGIEEHDEDVLNYLQDITKTDLDAKLPQKGFKLDFVFKENPYFANSSLWVEFHVDYNIESYKPYLDSDCIEVKSSEIEWKAGKNVTVEVVAKKVKGGGAKKAKAKAKSKEEPRASFFRNLFRSLKVGDEAPADFLAMLEGMEEEPDEDDMDGIVKFALANMHEVGHSIAEEIIPYAVRFYTGEAGDADSDDDDEDSESEDDDDEDEDDSEDEPQPKASAKKKGGKAAAPGDGGKKEEECKQQ